MEGPPELPLEVCVRICWPANHLFTGTLSNSMGTLRHNQLSNLEKLIVCHFPTCCCYLG